MTYASFGGSRSQAVPSSISVLTWQMKDFAGDEALRTAFDNPPPVQRTSTGGSEVIESNLVTCCNCFFAKAVIGIRILMGAVLSSYLQVTSVGEDNSSNL